MTFVLNILHKDYSLLAADRRGKSDGPVSIFAAGISITTSGNTGIDGVQKIYLSKNADQAVGIAGTVGDHGYLGAFSEVSDGQTALECVSDFVHLAFDFDARDRMLNNEAVMENQPIVTFFDPDKGAFFSSLYLFTPFTHAVQLYARRANASPILLHVGSGSSNFEKAVGLEEINSFVKRLYEGLDLEQRLAWFDEAFAKVTMSRTRPLCTDLNYGEFGGSLLVKAHADLYIIPRHRLSRGYGPRSRWTDARAGITGQLSRVGRTALLPASTRAANGIHNHRPEVSENYE